MQNPLAMPDIYADLLERQKAIKDKLSYRVRGAIYEVHRVLGPGLMEAAYQAALMRELHLRGIKAEEQVHLPVIYKSVEVKEAYLLDILVEDQIIIELKSVDELKPIHYKQLINYLHLKNLYVGFLVNFNCISLDKENFSRVYNNEASDKTEI